MSKRKTNPVVDYATAGPDPIDAIVAAALARTDLTPDERWFFEQLRDGERAAFVFPPPPPRPPKAPGTRPG